MKKLSLKEIHQRELKMLVEFDSFCKDNKLNYSLAGGTLLGAVRHKGFIPWDDDIDVCMPRKDFEVFINKYKDIGNDFEVKSIELKNGLMPFAKLVDKKTFVVNALVEDETALDKQLWIDIFPIDGLPDNIDEVRMIYRKVSIYRKIMGLSHARIGRGRNYIHMLGKAFLKPIAYLYGMKRAAEKIEKIARSYPYDNYNYVGCISWGLYGIGERMKKSDFERKTQMEFEGKQFQVYSCWHEYLTGLYGDYMVLPPKEKRVTHENVVYEI